MNQEAINSAYEDFVKGGYTGTIQGFIELMKTNKEARQSAFEDFVKGGYQGDMNGFKKLMGVGNQRSSTRSSNVEQKSKSKSMGYMSEESLLASYDFPQIDGVTVFPDTYVVYNGKPYTRKEIKAIQKEMMANKDNKGLLATNSAITQTNNIKFRNPDIYNNYEAKLKKLKIARDERYDVDKNTPTYVGEISQMNIIDSELQKELDKVKKEEKTSEEDLAKAESDILTFVDDNTRSTYYSSPDNYEEVVGIMQNVPQTLDRPGLNYQLQQNVQSSLLNRGEEKSVTAYDQILQDYTLREYMEKNDISFRGLNEDAVKKARGKILNSQEYIDLKKANNDEFNDVGNKIKDALDQDPPDLETVKQLKQDYPLFDDLVKQLVKNGRIEDLENEFIKNLEKSEGKRYFTGTKRQKELAEEAEKRLETIRFKSSKVMDKLEGINSESEKIFKEIRRIDSDYFAENTVSSIKARIKEITDQEFTTQEEVDNANQLISNIINEHVNKVKYRNSLLEKGRDYEELGKKYLEDLEKVTGNEEELTAFYKAADRNPGVVTAVFADLANATLDLGQGLIDFADMTWQIGENLLAELPEPWAQMATSVYNATPGVGRLFGDHLEGDGSREKVSLWNKAGENLDLWQYENITSQIRKPMTYKDVDGLGAGIEFASRLIVTQVPNLVLMAKTGGASLYWMGASAAGSKYRQLQNEKELYYQTGGLYGQNNSFASMVFNANASGVVEALSERVTLGALNRTKKVFTGSKGLLSSFDDVVKTSYRKYLRDEVFTFKNTKAFAFEVAEEANSEVLAQIGGNAADIFISGNNEVSIFDGIDEAAISGGLISGAIQSPRLLSKLSQPFTSSDVEIERQNIATRLHQISREMSNASLDQKELLEAEYVSLVDKSNELLEQTIKSVDVLTNPQKSELIDIQKQKDDLQRKAVELEGDVDNLTPQEKTQKANEYQNQINELNKRKNDILKKVKKEDVDKKYKQNVDAIKLYQDKINDRGVVEINVEETNTNDLKNKITEGYTGRDYDNVVDFSMQLDGLKEGYQQILKDKNSTQEERNEARQAIDQIDNAEADASTVLNIAEGNARNYGAFAPRLTNDGKVVGLDIIINKETALENGMINTASHEFVHAAFFNTLKADPIARETLGSAVDQLVDDGDITFKNTTAESSFNARVKVYDNAVRPEEKMTIITEMVRDGNATIKENGLQKIASMFRRFSQTYLGREIKLDSKKDILNFIKDFDVSIKNNKPNKAIIKMLEKGAKGKMFKDARTPEQVKSETQFSRAVDANVKSNPDLKQTFDNFVQNEDGTPKHVSQAEFALTPDFTNAYFAIVEGRSLDALIQQGMTELGLPPEALREFTRKVKEEVGRRFLQNYSLDKNKSLFGWLTGVSGGAGRSIIYRAKGDVMNEYKRENRVEETSLDKPVGDAGTLSDVLIGERDSALEALENMDLSPGRKQAARELINEVKVKEALGLDADTRQSLRDAIVNANLDITDLTYKDFKQLVAGVDKITRKDKSGNIIVNKKTGEPKLFNPTKTADASPSGALYNVLETLSAEFGIDPLRVLANQDLDAKQRKSAQEKILALSTNADGTFNDILFQLLPEGETRSGQATGIADTKLGDLYITGERLKVSEGASKKLGQKRSQTKIDSVERDNFLGLFGITPDGTFETGTANDGAIRQLVTSLSQLAANQETRLNSITNGTATEAIRAKLADGKSQMAFSKNSAEQNVVDAAYEDILQVMSADPSLTSIEKAVDDVVGNLLSKSQKNALAKRMAKLVGNYKAETEVFAEGDVISLAEFAANQLEFENMKLTIEDALQPRDENNKKVTVAQTTRNKDSVNKQRRNLSLSVSKLTETKGVKTGVEYAIKYLLPSFGGMGKIGDGSLVPKEDGGEVIDNPNFVKGKGLKRIKDGEVSYSKTNRSQITTGKKDILALFNKGLPSGYSITSPKVGQYLLVNPDGSQTPLETTTPNENTEDFLKDIEKKGAEAVFKERKAIALEAREVLEITLDNAFDRAQNGELNTADLALLITSLGSHMESPLRKAANAEYIADNIQDIIANRGNKSINQVTQYEHMKSKSLVAAEIINSYREKGRLDKKIFDNYQVQVISYEHNKLIDDSGYKLASTLDGRSRAFNKKTLVQAVKNPSKYFTTPNGRPAIAPIRSIDPNNKQLDGEMSLKYQENWIKAAESLRENNEKGQSLVGKMARSGFMFSKQAPKSRGMSAFDFDETLIIDGDNFIIATDPTTGKETKISSADWPIKGPELMNQGYDFNFDDFINVRGGVEGPLFQKLKNRIAKFGPENNYILTARPAESAVAIHGWLKSKGINIPLENITGLGNSTGEAKAMWMADKYAEGYNDMYFVDDALPNVEAVRDVMDQLDIKGSSVQAKFNFSKEFDSSQFDNVFEDGMNDMKEDLDLDIILEETKGVPREKKFSKAKAIRRGKGKGRFKFFLPPSAEDFKGLIYSLLGKGKKGERHHKFFKEKLFDPYAKAMRALHMLKQSVSYDMRALKKANKDIAKKLNKDIPGLEFTLDQAIRVYNYNKNGFDIPGMSQTDINALIKHVESNPDIQAFADGVDVINQKAGGLVAPDDAWLAENISIATNAAADNTRDNLLSEFNNNVDTIFSEENMNKLQAVYGPNYVEALKDVIYRMKSGSNRPEGMSRLMNGFMDWINGSVGATMFFNARSAVLQTLSTVNFINWSDNNPLKVAKTLANPKQFATDFISLFNSDFLKQRRSGLQQDLNAKEMAEAIRNSKNPVRAVIGYILQKGFLPTQMADSFAIAMGGASFYRNRVNSYLEQGLNQKEAETKAFEDFQEIAEETQQSARPDKISQQQASPLGKLILAFQNTPMQYNRLIKRAMQDLVNGRGDAKTHISKILYYGAIQNAIFYGLQQALFAVAFGDDEEEEKDNDDKYFNIGNGMIDSLLRGSGFAGAAVSTLKNMVLEFMEQEESKYQPDHAYTLIEMLNLSPPVGIKARKLYSATQSWEFNEKVIKQMSLTQFDNPIYEAAFSATEAITNVPLSRLYSKIRNIREAMNSDNKTWERVALMLGWSTWNFGIKPQAVIDAKQEVKEIQKEERKKKNEIKKQERKEKEEAENKIKIEENKKLQEEEKKEGKKVQCAAISRSGKRCKNEALPGKSFCTIHDEVEQGDKEVQCSHIKKDGKRCKMKTKNKSGLCYYHD